MRCASTETVCTHTLVCVWYLNALPASIPQFNMTRHLSTFPVNVYPTVGTVSSRMISRDAVSRTFPTQSPLFVAPGTKLPVGKRDNAVLFFALVSGAPNRPFSHSRLLESVYPRKSMRFVRLAPLIHSSTDNDCYDE